MHMMRMDGTDQLGRVPSPWSPISRFHSRRPLGAEEFEDLMYRIAHVNDPEVPLYPAQLVGLQTRPGWLHWLLRARHVGPESR